jgi:hypothetical protein
MGDDDARPSHSKGSQQTSVIHLPRTKSYQGVWAWVLLSDTYRGSHEAAIYLLITLLNKVTSIEATGFPRSSYPKTA